MAIKIAPERTIHICTIKIKEKMATLKTTTAIKLNTVSLTSNERTSIFSKYLAFLDGQHNRTLWFLIALSVQATVTLPLPLALIGYFNAPVACLGITMLCFFTTFVTNMGGSGIRTTLTCFLVSMAIHVAMVLWFVS